MWVCNSDDVLCESFRCPFLQGDIGYLNGYKAWDDIHRHDDVTDLCDPVAGLQGE